MLLRYCLSDFEMVPVAPVITKITFAFTFHMRWIYSMRSLYFKIFSASFLITLLSPVLEHILTYIFLIPCLLSQIILLQLLLLLLLLLLGCVFTRKSTPYYRHLNLLGFKYVIHFPMFFFGISDYKVLLWAACQNISLFWVAKRKLWRTLL